MQRSRTASAARASPPPICSRHEPSTAVQTSAPRRYDRGALVGQHRARRVRVLDGEGAAEAAAFVASGTRRARGRGPLRRSRSGASPTRVDPQRMAGRVVGDPVRERGADVLDPEPLDEQLRQLEEPRRPRAERSPGSRDRCRAPFRRTTTTARPPPRTPRRSSRTAARARLLRRDSRCSTWSLPAARLLGRELDLVAEPLEDRDGGLRRVGEQRVTETRGEEADAHGLPRVRQRDARLSGTSGLVREVPRQLHDRRRRQDGRPDRARRRQRDDLGTRSRPRPSRTPRV